MRILYNAMAQGAGDVLDWLNEHSMNSMGHDDLITPPMPQSFGDQAEWERYGYEPFDSPMKKYAKRASYEATRAEEDYVAFGGQPWVAKTIHFIGEIAGETATMAATGWMATTATKILVNLVNGRLIIGAAERANKIRSWWRLGAESDAEWAALSPKNKLYYEIGQKVLSPAEASQFASVGGTDVAGIVARGKEIVRVQGWLPQFMPSRDGIFLGSRTVIASGETVFSTGPTPLGRTAFRGIRDWGTRVGASYYLSQREWK